MRYRSSIARSRAALRSATTHASRDAAVSTYHTRFFVALIPFTSRSHGRFRVSTTKPNTPFSFARRATSSPSALRATCSGMKMMPLGDSRICGLTSGEERAVFRIT